GLNVGVTSDVIQAFLDAPEASISSGGMFDGQLAQVAINRDDLGLDWQPSEAGRLVADRLGLGPEDTRGVYMGAVSRPGQQGSAVVNVLWQRPSLEQAHADFLREMRGTFAELTRLADPRAADECRAWQGSATGGTLTIVVCRVDNVVVEEALVGAADQ